MAGRSDRLKRLVKLQEQIKALHETRHAQHLSEAASASREAAELVEALNAASPLPGIFPDLYNRRIGAAVDREAKGRQSAREEAGRVAVATARTNLVTRAYGEARRLEDREEAEKEQFEALTRVPKERE